LFVITETGMLQISTADAPLIPKKGQTVIALIHDSAEAASRRFQEEE
jgi:hypothetical protein